MAPSTIRIATRASKLALWQAEYIKSLIELAGEGVSVEIVHVRTIGDTNQTDALRQFGGTGVFTREVQQSVLSGETDIAVHSLKDLQTEPTDGLILAGVPDRAPTADALLLPSAAAMTLLEQLPQGARVGTGSPRRQAQLLCARPDLRMLEIRGNVDTRIRKLDDGEFDAIMLAAAGLQRLGMADRISLLLSTPLMYPAVGQGAIGIECRTNDAKTSKVLASITNSCVLAGVLAERSLLSELRAGCHAPLGAMSEVDGDKIRLTAVLLSLDGRQRLEATAEGETAAPVELGRRVAELLLAQGGKTLVDAN